MIIILYSSLGGVRSVTFTDTLQFIILFIFPPLLFIIIYADADSVSLFGEVTIFREVMFSIKALKGKPIILGNMLCLSSLVFSSPIFQRLQMSKDAYQAKKSFSYSSILWVFLASMIISLGLLIQRVNPNVPRTDSTSYILSYILSHYNITGFNGLVAIGLMAMIMSTADSYLNTTAVIISKTFSKILGINKANEVSRVRITNLCIGILSLMITLSGAQVWAILKYKVLFYFPVIVVPLLFTMLGFRSTSRVVISGMMLGFSTSLLCFFRLNGGITYVVLPGMLANLLTLLGLHYLLGEPGGWVGVKENAPLIQQRRLRSHRWLRLKERWAAFSLYNYLAAQLPEGKGWYFVLGIYGLCTNLIAYFVLPQPQLVTDHRSLMVLLLLGLVLCSLIATYGGWPSFMQQRKLAAYGYPLAIGYIFFLVTPMLLVLSGMKSMLLFLLIINGALSLFLFAPMLAATMALMGHALAYLLTYKVGGGLDWSGYAASELLLLLAFTLGAYYILHRYRQEIFALKSGIQAALYSKKIYSDRYQKLRRVQDDHHRELMQGTSNGMKRNLSSIALLSTQIDKKEKTSAMADTAKQLDMQLQGSKQLFIDKVDQMGRYITMDYKTYPIKQLLDDMEDHLQSLPEMAPIAYEHGGLQAEVVWDKDRLYSFVGDLLRHHFTKDPNIAFFVSSHATQITYADLEGRKEPAVALRIVQGIVEDTPKIATGYIHHKPEDHASSQKELYRTVDAHYGVLERDKDGRFFTLVLPQNAKKVRPKIIDDKLPIAFSEEQKLQLYKAETNFSHQLIA